MAKLVWDATGEHLYETGVDHGVLYVVDDTKQGDNKYGTGVVWNGLTTVSENPSGAEPTALWADNIKYLNLMSAEDFACTIEAYTYPEEFMECDGSAEIADGVYIRQQKRKMFGFTYRTRIGNDVDNDDHGYKIHIVYACLASPSERSYSTVNDSPEAVTLSWEISTLPIRVDDTKTTAEFEFDGQRYKSLGLMNVLHAIEDILYGTDDTPARLIMPEELPALYTYFRYIRDSAGEMILDSSGQPLQSAVYD